MISKSKQFFILFNCSVSVLCPLSLPSFLLWYFFNSDHFWEIITQKLGGPDETAIQLLCDVICQPIFVSVLIKHCREEDEGVERGFKLTYVSVWGRKRKQTHRGDLKHLKCLAGALSDIWWLNCHRPVLSSTNADWWFLLEPALTYF